MKLINQEMNRKGLLTESRRFEDKSQEKLSIINYQKEYCS